VTFERPLALLALLVVPALAGLWLLHERHRAAEATRFASPALIPNLLGRRPGWVRYLPLGLLLLALSGLLVGAARPHAVVKVPRKEATIVLALDVSRSMNAQDVKPTRLAAARAAAVAFLDKVPDTYSVAVVAFGSRAVVAVPPTTDRALVRAGLANLNSGEGTAIGDAVLISAQLGRRHRDADGAVPPTTVLVISDGAPQGGRTPPLTAAKRARALHVPVSTVLVGTASGVVTAKLVGGYTEQIRVPPSPGTLQQIASITGGQFFRARTSTALTNVYQKLATRTGHRKQDREITDVFAGGALAFLLVGGGLSAALFRRVP
jgi:Ca-activated chloride channel family protein